MVQSPWCLLNFELCGEGYNTCQCRGLGLNGRHTFYSHQTLQVMGLGLALGLRVLVNLFLSAFQILDSSAYTIHEIPS